MQCGWTQSSKTWTISKDTSAIGDTVVTYKFQKKDLVNLRVYVATLEQYKSTAEINEEIINKQKLEMLRYKTLITNKDIIITDKDLQLVQSVEINAQLQKQLEASRKRAKAWPYWLGGGFLGGIILCLSVK